mmetsp:Transcript_27267/g.66968  ORF Transcript_27267/g.66968 Transcript_27267/m.66968 type:complete len:753 (+) Transcript_27267:93-2351(+)
MASPADIAITEKHSGNNAVVIKLSEIAKNIDLDGDGSIDPEERQILDTLKKMDIDGDGNISLKELVNLGKALNVADSQARTYKRIIYAVVLFCFAAIAATFLACLGAVEAAKDARPDASGTMLTTSITGESKVVQTQKHVSTIALTALYKASYSTLQGVNSLGFQVGLSFYQYTITGFQQDLAADGKSAVRFYTSRGDTIYVTATAATLEKTSGATLDISAASTLTRHLLSTGVGAARDLLNDEDMDGGMDGGMAQSDGPYDAYADATIDALYNLLGNNSNTSAPDFSGGNFETLLFQTCMQVTNAHPAPKDGTWGCKCNPGFKGSVVVMMTPASVYTASGSCTMIKAPATAQCRMNEEFGPDEVMDWINDNPDSGASFKAVECQCNENTHKGQVSWNFAKEAWNSTCTPRTNVPAAGPGLKYVLWEEPNPNTDEYGIKEFWAQFKCPPYTAGGYAAFTPGQTALGGRSGSGSGKWDTMPCKPEPCPGDTVRTTNNVTKVTTCACNSKHSTGQGFAWKTDYYSYWSEVDQTLKPDDTGEMVPMACEPKAECPKGSHLDDKTGKCKCEFGYTGGYTFMAATSAWVGSCAAAACPTNALASTKMYGTQVTPTCACNKGFTDVADMLVFDSTQTKWNGTCAAMATCPANSAVSKKMTLYSAGMSTYYGDACACNAGYDGDVNYDVYANTFFSSCLTLTCPTNQVKQAMRTAGITSVYCDCPGTHTTSFHTTSYAMACCPTAATPTWDTTMLVYTC